MGFISDVLSPNKGTGFQAQGSQNIKNPVTEDQIAGSLVGAKSGIEQQQQFLNAIRDQNAISRQGDVYGQQQALANQLGLQAQGQGPNPALAQLAQTTGQNAAQQAALMAGQRGSGANAGLLARQAAMQGGNIQQQAAGQAAIMKAQQQLAAQQALQQQQQAMVANASNQAAQQLQGLNQYNQFAQNLYGQQLGSINNQNQANIQNQSGVNNANSALAGNIAQMQGGILGGVMGGAGSAMGLAKAHGGMIGYSDGGDVKPPPPPPPIDPYKAKQVQDSFKKALGFAEGGVAEPTSFFGKFSKGFGSGMGQMGGSFGSGMQMGQGIGQVLAGGMGALFNKPMVGKNIAAPGATDIQTQLPIQSMAAQGGKVPGNAKVKGDSYSNDNVPAMLSPKEIVLPRSITMHPDAANKAKDFVEAILAKHNMGKKK